MLNLLRSAFLGFILVLCLLIFGVEAQIAPATDARVYLPGDFVHVIVEAPVDTTQITAVMPDGNAISLIQGRRTNTWRGIWQVPINFKKGVYSAKLSAVDVKGDVFEGETDSFNVGEIALITLVSMTKEAGEKPALREKITIEPVVPGGEKAKAEGEEELIKTIMKVISQPSPLPAPALESREKAELIERNLEAGKRYFDQGKLLKATAYFKIALYLSPKNKEAGLYLAQAGNLIKEQEEKRRGFYTLLAVLVSALILGIGVLLWFFRAAIPWRFFPGSKPAGAVSEGEKRSSWLKKAGWKKNPFALDILRQIFTGRNVLELEGLKGFIKAQIESAGGKNADPFTDSALEKVYELSKGSPEQALKICDWAVTQAALQGGDQITAELIKGYERIGLKKILIADDEEIVRASLDAILRKGGGYETDFAVDGEEAIDKIKQNLYGLVLLDIEMPKIDGYKILKQVRKVYPDLPVIFVTGKGTPRQTLESMSKYELTGYIAKPFTPEKVLDVVARTLKVK